MRFVAASPFQPLDSTLLFLSLPLPVLGRTWALKSATCIP